MGASWGGLAAVTRILRELPRDLGTAIAIAQHRRAGSGSALAEVLAHECALPVDEAEDKQPIEPNRVYVAPSDYHLLVEPGHFALSVDERVQFARPSIDVLFESAADAYRERLLGVLLTGANDDGAAGLAAIRARGGCTVVQDPSTAERREMPDSAIAAGGAVTVLPLEQIGSFLASRCRSPHGAPA